METRKLQEVGGGTYTISIPKQWATNHGFEVGMELQLYTHRDGSILVRSSEADVDRLNDATVEVDGGTEAVTRAVRSAYGLGFETIRLRRASPFPDAERKAVRATVRGLVGTNIRSESDTEITIRHLLDTSSVSVSQSIVQLQYLVAALLRDATRSFVEAADAHGKVRDRADEAHRSADMVTRHFSRSLISHAELDELGVARTELFAYYATARRLKSAAEQAVRIATVGERLSEPPAAETAADVRAAVDDVASALEDAVTVVFAGDVAEARRARAECDEAAEAVEAIKRRVSDGSISESVPTAVALADGLSHLLRAADCGRGVADVAVRAAIRAANDDV